MNKIPAHKLFGLIGAILIIVVLLWVKVSNNKSVTMNDDTASSTMQFVASTTAMTQSSATTEKKGPAPVAQAKAPVAPVTKTPVYENSSYLTYSNDLAAARSYCATLADNQYRQLYYGKYSSLSNQSYVNRTTGGCYARITGLRTFEGSASTTAVVFFRDIYANKSLAECENPNGNIFGPGPWSCIAKTTGKSITKDEFDSLVTSYLSE